MIDIFFNGVDIVDACAGTRHFIFADEKFIGRGKERNNFGVRASERDSFSHDACNGWRGGVDKIFGDGSVTAENFRRGVSFILSVRRIQIRAGEKAIRNE